MIDRKRPWVSLSALADYVGVPSPCAALLAKGLIDLGVRISRRPDATGRTTLSLERRSLDETLAGIWEAGCE